jgi:hypothetical protein
LAVHGCSSLDDLQGETIMIVRAAQRSERVYSSGFSDQATLLLAGILMHIPRLTVVVSVLIF